MSVLGILTVSAVVGVSSRPLLLILLVCAVFFLLAGAILALVALRNLRKNAGDTFQLEQLESEAEAG
jgi:hypothetical protein